MKDESLSIDEFDALTQISKAKKNERPSACVARNVKRLSGLKYVVYAKDGSLGLSDKGTQILFVKDCIEGLRAISTNALAELSDEVVAFLSKKGHIKNNAAGGFDITQKGSESLVDIDASAR